MPWPPWDWWPCRLRQIDQHQSQNIRDQPAAWRGSLYNWLRPTIQVSPLQPAVFLFCFRHRRYILWIVYHWTNKERNLFLWKASALCCQLRLFAPYLYSPKMIADYHRMQLLNKGW